jgi:hypothetical protein
VRYAFHFIDEGGGWDGTDRALFQALLQFRRRNFLVHRGNVVHWAFGKSTEQIVQNASHIHSTAAATMSPEAYIDLITSARPYVQLLQGLTRHQAALVHESLTAADGYVGALGLHFDDPKHWAAYASSLPVTYRLVGTELRMCWRSFDGDDAELFVKERCEHWRRTGMFGSVALEDVGVRETVFDVFETPEHAALETKTEDMLGDLLEGVACEVALRASDLDPRLVEALHAALQSLASAHTSEELAQASIACRRFLERFADRVFPPTADTRNGRKLGPAEWKNRLWTFAEDSLGAVGAGEIGVRLGDIGSRIDWVAEEANAGVHRPDVDEIAVTRLVIGMTSLVYDLCLLSPPPHDLPGAGYEKEAMTIIRQMLSRRASGDD